MVPLIVRIISEIESFLDRQHKAITAANYGTLLLVVLLIILILLRLRV